MGVSKFQDFWRTGSRFYFQADPVKESPLLDLGTIAVASPATTIEQATLTDSDGGLAKVVAQDLSKFEEKYDLQLYNLSPKNLGFLFFADGTVAFSQAAGTASAAHVGRLGELFKIRSSYSEPFDYIYNLSALRAVGLPPFFAITAITSTKFTFTVPTGRTAASIISVGDVLRVFSNATSAANTEYVVTAVAGTGATAEVTVATTNGATASGSIALCECTLANMLTHPITGGSSTTITIAGDWTLHYAAGTRLHYWGGTTTSAGNNSIPAASDATHADTGLNTYLIASVAFATGTTTITIDASTPLVAAPTATGTIMRALRNGSDYEIGDLQRGFVRTFSTATGFVDKQPVLPLWITNAISADQRLLRPQTKQGPFEGTGIIEWARGNFAQRTVREFRCSIVPGAGAFSDTEFSNFPLSVTVLSDPTDATSPAGRLLYYKGDMPASS